MINNRKIGESILFINGYGIPIDEEHYNFRYGYVSAGFITDMEYIEARNSYLYTVSTVSPFDRYKTLIKILGSHLIFDLNAVAEAELKLSEICEEPDFHENEV